MKAMILWSSFENILPFLVSLLFFPPKSTMIDFVCEGFLVCEDCRLVFIAL